MGNTPGREKEGAGQQQAAYSRHDQVDGGYLFTQGVYKGTQDFKMAIVRSLIIDRRMQPFYKGLDEFDPAWSDGELAKAVWSAIYPDAPTTRGSAATDDDGSSSVVDGDAAPRSRHSSFSSHATGTPTSGRATSRPRAQTVDSSGAVPRVSTFQNSHVRPVDWQRYRHARECPICFLNYPANFNVTRCCQQDICSECFVQIKRADPHPPTVAANEPAPPSTELVSEPAACPFCMEPEFGIVYTPPATLGGIMPNNTPRVRTTTLEQREAAAAANASANATAVMPTGPAASRTPRKSFAASSPNVITTDMIRPDWREKLRRARARAAKRAANSALLNAHLLQTGPVPGAAGGGHVGASRRGGRNVEASQRARDIEELMMMEAIRLSLLDQEERQREEQTGADRGGEQAAGGGVAALDGPGPGGSESPRLEAGAANADVATCVTDAMSGSIAAAGPATGRQEVGSPLPADRERAGCSANGVAGSSTLDKPEVAVSTPPANAERVESTSR